MGYDLYQVGEVNEKLIGNERVIFDINDSGAVLYVLFDNPTKNEIQQFDKDIEIRYVKVGSVFMMLFKFGNLNWIDAPYSPHLSRFAELEEPADGEGIGLQIIFGDCRTGMVHYLRLVGLSTEFSRKMVSDIAEDLKRPFNKDFYSIDISAVMNQYRTDDLVNMATNSCVRRRTDNV